MKGLIFYLILIPVIYFIMAIIAPTTKIVGDTQIVCHGALGTKQLLTTRNREL